MISRGRVAVFCLVGLAIPGLSQEQEATPTSFGILLTGGGSFGAFEAGAVKTFFELWRNEHENQDPPIRVISGTSTGALIGPFVALGWAGVQDVAGLYTSIRQGDIPTPKAAVVLPFFLFSICGRNGDAWWSWRPTSEVGGPLHLQLPPRTSERSQRDWIDCETVSWRPPSRRWQLLRFMRSEV